MKENRMKSSQRKKREGREREGQREGGETEKDTEQKEHKAGREKHGKKKKKTLKALKDRNISVEIHSEKKMRGAMHWQGKGLFGIGQNGFEKLIITVEIVQILKTKLS